MTHCSTFLDSAAGTVYNVPPDPWPIVLSSPNHGNVVAASGDILNVLPGASLHHFNPFPLEIGLLLAQSGSQVNISGGFIDPRPTAEAGSVLSISGGIINLGFEAKAGSQMFISGGSMGGPANVRAGAKLTMSGGSYGSLLFVDGEADFTGGSVGFISAGQGADISIAGSSAVSGLHLTNAHGLISGGQVQNELTVFSGTLDVSGGAINALIQLHGGVTNLIGTQFYLDGVPIPGLSPGIAVPVLARGVMLTGTLRDGSPISIDLNATQGPGDFVSAAALLTVRQVPEAEAWALILGIVMLAPAACRPARR